MRYRIIAIAMLLTVSVPDYDNFENQECHQVEECE